MIDQVLGDLSRIPLVSLRPFRYGPRAILVDPIDSRAAQLLDEHGAREHGLLIYAQTPGSLYVAARLPMNDTARGVLKALGRRIRLAQATSADLAAAYDRVYPSHPPKQSAKPSATASRAKAAVQKIRIGDLLRQGGKLPAASIDEALQSQATDGGRLGWLLTSRNEVTYLDVAEAVAEQHGLPFVDLLNGEGGSSAVASRLDATLFDLMPESFWRSHLAVPIGRSRLGLRIAMVDPEDTAAAQSLQAASGVPLRLAVTGYRDVLAALEEHYQQEYTYRSLADLVQRRPEDSAHQLLSLLQRSVLIAIVILLAIGMAVAVMPTLTVVNAVLGVLYFWVLVHKMILLMRPTDELLEIGITQEDLDALDPASLPPYTVLVPAYREAAVLPILTKALTELDYPKDRLDVKLLLEEDDLETIDAAKAMRLPNYIEILVVPPSQPKTKPKACNYGLSHARGEYLVIYDAEDIPERDQLKKAIAAFRKAPANVSCVQAKLSYFNWDQNILTRWFTAEYAAWFDLLLPALHGARLPIPLGGTSNHFLVRTLVDVGAWDPYNVAEDADLGIRLYKAGYQTLVMDSTTYEEANSDFVNWIRQRSRWVKGYIQTWFVHMRHPVRLYRELGPKGFLGFQLVVGGTPFPFLVNPLYWLMTTLWFLSLWRSVPLIFPSWLYYLASINLFAGNFSFIFINMVGAARRGDWRLIKYEVAMPVYWSMMSVAAWKAALQLLTRPFYWEKTEHGLLLETMQGAVQPPMQQEAP
ncbi:MAG: glycosyltransferase [Thermaerobacter sp.]|nr:glycosyltransferase [Thermaerobacter sp.]